MPMALSVGRLPRIELASGALSKLPTIAAGYGRRALVVTGARSFAQSGAWERLSAGLREAGLIWQTMKVAGEPSPALVDEAVREFRAAGIEVVIGIGGGSALDAAKAIAGLLRPGNSVRDHLEGVGPEKSSLGPVTPFIAVPTTAGTGSEATRNAVLTERGPGGFKKSFRDEKLVAEHAVVDPELLAGAPPELIAANGMDAFTQLLESYVSTRANAITDALAAAGMRAVRDGLFAWHAGGGDAAAGREKMAYAALLSGICLAQTGLGSVHGLASPLGALFPIPHGVVCGTLVAAATRVNAEVMEARDPGNPALAKYARVGRLLGGRAADDARARAALADTLGEWSARLRIPTLAALGVAAPDLPRIVAASRGSSMRTNPVVLTDEEVERILRSRL
ncbi:MAG: alcohol dehydrogenase [Rhodocyclales bacterium CG_4_9_14_3_um_filter_68_10]|nr:MAG: alcohol dehydrogenase [Rhodocyclales bacterium CG_4_9_14_3_um_filter_68_10]